jgi:ubiquinone/menaquinone biosynthesis C-methylase UbiE
MNVDASLNALVAPWPRFVHVLLYRLSGANRYYALEEYCRLLETHRFVHHDLAHSLPFPDASADFVYSSHFLEHLFQKDARRLLSESFRILRPGGTVRVCVPDLEHAVSLYAAGRKREMLDNYFFVEDMESYLARHKYMYDFEMLKAELEGAGFRDVTRCAYREGRTPDLAVLDNRPDETLFVEALK